MKKQVEWWPLVVGFAALAAVIALFFYYGLPKGGDAPVEVTDRYERALLTDGIPDCGEHDHTRKAGQGDVVTRLSEEDAGKVFRYVVDQGYVSKGFEPLLGVVFTMSQYQQLPTFLVIARQGKDLCTALSIGSLVTSPIKELNRKYAPKGWEPQE